MSLRVRLDPLHAAPRLAHLPPQPKRRIRNALRALADDPTGLTNGLDVKRLNRQASRREAYRLRLGDWRVAFAVEKDLIAVLKIFHQREGYGWLEDAP